MDQYQGYRAEEPEARPERVLPELKIYGTSFVIDIARHEFRQADNPLNRMTMGDVPEEMGFTHFLYDTETKNRFAGQIAYGDPVPDHVRIILVPPLKELDPDGLALRQGLPPWKKEHRPREVRELTSFGQEKSGRKKGKHF